MTKGYKYKLSAESDSESNRAHVIVLINNIQFITDGILVVLVARA